MPATVFDKSVSFFVSHQSTAWWDLLDHNRLFLSIWFLSPSRRSFGRQQTLYDTLAVSKEDNVIASLGFGDD